MAWNKTRTATFFDKEILKYFGGSEVTKNVVIDSTSITPLGDGRVLLEAGQVLSWVGAINGKVRPADGDDAQAEIAGILTHTVEFFYPNSDSKTDEPAAVYFVDAHFSIPKLVGYTPIAAAVKAALPSCRFYA